MTSTFTAAARRTCCSALSSAIFLLACSCRYSALQAQAVSSLNKIPGVVGEVAFYFACTYFASFRCTSTWSNCVCNLTFLSRSCSTKRCSCCIAQSCGSFCKQGPRPAELHPVQAANGWHTLRSWSRTLSGLPWSHSSASRLQKRTRAYCRLLSTAWKSDTEAGSGGLSCSSSIQ